MTADDALAHLSAAREAVELAGHLDRQLEAALEASSRSAADLAAAQEALAEEERDVAALQRASWASVLASVKGTKDDDLRREQAEALDARVRSGQAESRHRQDTDAVAVLQQRRAELGDVQARLRAAQDERHAWLASHDAKAGPRLTEIAETSGRLAAERHELDEALSAATRAHESLVRALEQLGKAGDWAAWDTFGGGGLFTDAMKYDRLEGVGRELERAGAALRHLDAELADVHLAAVGALEIGSFDHTFDVWFDNFFSDMAVRGRIKEADQRLRAALETVSAAGRAVGARRDAVATELDRLARERVDLLG